jgi:uncharacterized protein (DUF433 family)
MSITTQPITVSPDILSGVPVFTGTRVPVKNLFDYLEAGDSLEKFIEDFPAVRREQVLEVLRLAGRTLLTAMAA